MGMFNRIRRRIKQAQKAARAKFAERQGINPELQSPRRKYMKGRRNLDGTDRQYFGRQALPGSRS